MEIDRVITKRYLSTISRHLLEDSLAKLDPVSVPFLSTGIVKIKSPASDDCYVD